jgi:hypothetical protein
MTTGSGSPTRFRVIGEVVEVFEREGDRRVVVVLESGAVLELELDCAGDVRLHDRVTVEGSLAVDAIAGPPGSGFSESREPRITRLAAGRARYWKPEA